MNVDSNIIPHKHKITVAEQNKHKKHRSLLLWFTGLSGSGKSTIADLVEQLLLAANIHTYLLDGDNVRTGLNKGLGFSSEDRHENLRRVAEMSKLFVDAGIVVLGAFVSPLKGDRQMVKDIVGKENFIEIFINTSLKECERKDVKGLYKKARAGLIKDFTGISSPYEPPENPEITIHTAHCSAEEAAQSILHYLLNELKIKL